MAKAQDSFDRWGKELEAISEVQQSPEIGAFLSSPTVGMSAKESALRECLAGHSPEAINLVRLLLHKGRFTLAPQIAEQYRQMLNEYRGIATAEVASAVPLDRKEIEAVARHLSNLTGRQVVVEAHVDPSILGGIVARVGDQLIDGSVKGRLEALKRRLSPV